MTAHKRPGLAYVDFHVDGTAGATTRGAPGIRTRNTSTTRSSTRPFPPVPHAVSGRSALTRSAYKHDQQIYPRKKFCLGVLY